MPACWPGAPPPPSPATNSRVTHSHGSAGPGVAGRAPPGKRRMAKAPGKQPPMGQDRPSPMDITPWVHIPPATGSTSVGAAGRSEAHPRHRTARHSTVPMARGPAMPALSRCGEHTRPRSVRSAEPFTAHTALLHRHVGAHGTPAPQTAHQGGAAPPAQHTATARGTQQLRHTAGRRTPAGSGHPGPAPRARSKTQKKKPAELARSPAAVRAAELCPAPAAPGASPGCTPQPCARPAPWHHHGPGAHCCHSIPPSSDIKHLCLLLLPEGEAAVDVAADVLVTELPQLRDQLGRLLPSLGCSSGCQPGGRRT